MHVSEKSWLHVELSRVQFLGERALCIMFDRIISALFLAHEASAMPGLMHTTFCRPPVPDRTEDGPLNARRR